MLLRCFRPLAGYWVGKERAINNAVAIQGMLVFPSPCGEVVGSVETVVEEPDAPTVFPSPCGVLGGKAFLKLNSTKSLYLTVVSVPLRGSGLERKLLADFLIGASFLVFPSPFGGMVWKAKGIDT